jgi:hypothetical protein
MPSAKKAASDSFPKAGFGAGDPKIEMKFGLVSAEENTVASGFETLSVRTALTSSHADLVHDTPQAAAAVLEYTCLSASDEGEMGARNMVRDAVQE